MEGRGVSGGVSGKVRSECSRLVRLFSLKQKINRTGKGSGKVRLAYYSERHMYCIHTYRMYMKIYR